MAFFQEQGLFHVTAEIWFNTVDNGYKATVCLSKVYYFKRLLFEVRWEAIRLNKVDLRLNPASAESGLKSDIHQINQDPGVICSNMPWTAKKFSLPSKIFPMQNLRV